MVDEQVSSNSSSSSSGGEKMPLDWLVNINNFLEKIPESVLNYFSAFTKMGENISQSYVDIVCRYAAWRVNITVERQRQKVLKSLCDQYGFILKIMSTINVGKQVISNPLGAVGSFFSVITKPLTIAIYFITTLATEIPRLAKNLANITSALPPTPPSPQINYDEFKLKIQTVSMGALLDAYSLPEPEILFPEPTKPWSKEAFQASFESGKNVFAEETADNQIKYTPKKKTNSSNTESSST